MRLPESSGAMTTIRWSLAPRATSRRRCSVATWRLVPRSTGSLSVRDGHRRRRCRRLADHVDRRRCRRRGCRRCGSGCSRRTLADRRDRLLQECAKVVGSRSGRAARRRPAAPCHQRHRQHLLVGARDADGDGLGLVLDGVDRTGELVDAAGERGGELLEHDARGAQADRARRANASSGTDAEWRSATETTDLRGRAGLQLAVVRARGRVRSKKLLGARRHAQRGQPPQQVVAAVAALAANSLDRGARFAQRQGASASIALARPRSRTDAPRPSPARSPADGCTDGTPITSQRGVEPRSRLRRRDHDRCGFVRAVDRDLLGDVVGVGSRPARRRTPGSAARPTGRCASCPRWRRRRSTCSRAPTA